jgi:hypothetical protein
MVYEGEFKGDANGIFNLVVQDEEWTIVAKDNDPDGGCGTGCSFYGYLVEEQLVCMQCDADITGTVDGSDSINGEWDAGDENGTWSGNRTL